MMGNYHARCGAGEKPEVETPEAYLSLFSLPDDLNLFESAYREVCEKIRIELLEPPKARRATTQALSGGRCERGESRKKRRDGIWSNPVYCFQWATSS